VKRTKHQVRNEIHAEYRSWLATQPCCVCFAPCEQLAHCGVGGMGLKHGDDDQCLPMCRRCHSDHDETKGAFVRPFFIEKPEWRSRIAAWDAHQVAVHRERFATGVDDAQGIPF
jgi:hypothetical protein